MHDASDATATHRDTFGSLAWVRSSVRGSVRCSVFVVRFVCLVCSCCVANRTYERHYTECTPERERAQESARVLVSWAEIAPLSGICRATERERDVPACRPAYVWRESSKPERVTQFSDAAGVQYF